MRIVNFTVKLITNCDVLLLILGKLVVLFGSFERF